MNIPDQDHIDKVILWISYAEEDLGLAQFALENPGEPEKHEVARCILSRPKSVENYARITRDDIHGGGLAWFRIRDASSFCSLMKAG